MRKECNFRDFGGIVCRDEKVLKKGLFYRGCCPARMNEEEQKEISDLGIKTILDLRTSYEVYEEPDPIIPGTEYFRVSGMRDSLGEGIDYSPEGIRRLQIQLPHQNMGMNDYMHQIYVDMMFDNQAFKLLVMCIEQKKLPVYFHCATGKDRTGALAMILLIVLGASDEEIMKDYLLSNESFQNKIELDYENDKNEIEKDPDIMNQILARDGVLPENGIAMLDAIKQRYISYQQYLLQQYGIDETRQNIISDYCLTCQRNEFSHIK